MMNFLKDGLSIDELKSSSVVLIFLTTSIFALVVYCIDGDITDNLLAFLFALLSVVGSVNIANIVASGKRKNKQLEIVKDEDNEPTI